MHAEYPRMLNVDVNNYAGHGCTFTLYKYNNLPSVASPGCGLRAKAHTRKEQCFRIVGLHEPNYSTRWL